MRQIKFRNYIILAVIIILTVVAVLALKRIYENNQEYEAKTNERLDILYEVKEDDLESYLVENRDIVIYISNAKQLDIETFENEFKNYIAENELSKEIVYLNLDMVSSKFYKNLENKYLIDYLKGKKSIIEEQENLLIIEEGKIKAILYEGKTSISMNDIKKFLQENDVKAD